MWSTTSKADGQPDHRPWISNADEFSRISFSAQLADTLIAGHGISFENGLSGESCGAGPDEDVFSGYKMCYDPSKPDYSPCCWAASTGSSFSAPQLEQYITSRTMSEITEEINSNKCTDKLSLEYWQQFRTPENINYIFPAFAKAARLLL